MNNRLGWFGIDITDCSNWMYSNMPYRKFDSKSQK